MLTPGAKIVDDDVVSIVAPGAAGYLGVLANHAPLITSLGTGSLKVKFANGVEKKYNVKGGFLRVARNTAVLLSESIEEASPTT
jgi:F-type H+-transporting ATPase subunit epsilon